MTTLKPQVAKQENLNSILLLFAEYIDFKDSNDMYRVGLVFQLVPSRNVIKIKADGCSYKADESIQISLENKEPFRKYTNGYTGPKMAHRPGWVVNIEKIRNLTEHMTNFLRLDLTHYTASTFNQLFRGTHFFYTDFLMSKTIEDLEIFQAVYKYLLLQLDYCGRWFRQFQCDFSKVDFETFKHLSDVEFAFQSSYPEVFQTISSLFGGTARNAPFFRNNRIGFHQVIQQLRDQPKMSIQQTIGFSFSRYFSEQRILFDFIELIRRLEAQEIYISFFFLKLLAYSFNILIRYFQAQLGPQKRAIQKIILSSIEKIDKNNAKDVHRAALADCIRRLKVLFAQEIEEIQKIERAEITIAYKLFQSNKLEHKILAFAFLADTLEKIDSKDTNNEFKVITEKDVFDYCVDSGFIKDALNQHSHVEVIKKGAELLVDICKAGSLTEEVLYLAFDLMDKTKDNTVSIVMSTALDKVIKKCKNVGLIRKFYNQKLVKGTFQELDPNKIGLIQSYLKQKGTHEEYIGFYQCIKSQPDNTQLIKWLYQAIIDNSFSKMYFINLCFEKLQKNQEVEMHMNLLRQILDGERIIDYKQQFREIIVESLLFDVETITESLFNDKLELLNLLKYHEEELMIDQAEFTNLYTKLKPHPTLFKCLVSFMVEDEKFDKRVNNIFDQIVNFIFEDILLELPDEEIFDMTLDRYYFLQAYFFQANVNLKKIQKNNSTKKYKVVASDLKGFHKLEEVLLRAQSQEVVNKCCSFICKIFFQMNWEVEELKEFAQIKITDKMLTYLRDTAKPESYNVAGRFLHILGLFLDEVSEASEERIPSSMSPHSLSFTVKSVDTKQTKFFLINQNCYIDKLKSTILAAFQLTSQLVTLHHSTIIFNSKTLDKPLKDIFKRNDMNFLQASFKKNAVKDFMSTCYLLFTQLLQTSICDKSWNLLSSMTIPQQVINSFQNHSHDEIAKHFQTKNIYVALNTMRIIQSFKTEWWNEFISSEGRVGVLLSNLEVELSPTVFLLYSQYINLLFSILFKVYVQKPKDQLEGSVIVSDIIKGYMRYAEYQMQQDLSPSKQSYQDQQQQTTTNFFQLVKLFQREMDLLNTSTVKTLLKYGVIGINNSNQFVKDTIHRELLSTISNHNLRDTPKVKEYIFELFESLFEMGLECNSFSNNNFYNYLAEVIQGLDTETMGALLEQNALLLNKALLVIDKMSPEPIGYQKEYNVLTGIALFIKQVVVRPETQISKLNSEIMAQYIFGECLFNTKSNIPKCRYQATRTTFYEIIFELSKQNPVILVEFANVIEGICSRGSWRRPDADHWNMRSRKSDRLMKYAGLINLSSTCYINSFFQQLFMIPSFRDSIINCEDPEEGKASKVANVLFQLKMLFVELQKSDKPELSTQAFCMAFKNYDGLPINVHEQMDIDEFSSMFFDRLEKHIKGTPSQNMIKNHFGGTFSNQILGGNNCPHSSLKQESFLSIPLQVKSSLEQSFKQMVTGESLEGDNAYFCESCDKKVNSTKRVCLKSLPNHLILVLKRIEFNYSSYSKVKINDRCEFPTDLDLKPYSDQYLRPPADDKDTSLLPDEYFKYTLKGVVVHSGSGQCGHYYSFIQERGVLVEGQPQQWFEFNDVAVNAFDPSQLPEQCYGSYESSRSPSRNRSAYVLIYDRNVKFDENNQIVEKMQVNPTMSTSTKQLYKHVEDENVSIRLERALFLNDLQEFTFSMLSEYLTVFNQDPQLRRRMVKYQVYYFLTIYIRKHEKDRDNLLTYFQKLDNSVAQCELDDWVLAAFSNKGTINEMFLTNVYNSQVKKHLVHFLLHCYQRYSSRNQNNPDNINDLDNYQIRKEFVLAMRAIVSDRYIFKRADTDQIFEILNTVVVRDPAMIPDPRQFLFCLISNLEDVLKAMQKKSSMNEDSTEEDDFDHSFFNEPRGLMGWSWDRYEYPPTYLKLGTPLDRAYVWGVMDSLLKKIDNESPTLKQYRFQTFYEYLNLFKSKAAYFYFNNYLSNFMKQNQKETAYVLALLNTFFSKSTNQNISQLMLVAKRLIAIEDSIQQKRVLNLVDSLENLCVIFNKEEITYGEVDTIAQWIIKISKCNPIFRSLFSVRKNKFVDMILNRVSVPDCTLAKNKSMLDKSEKNTIRNKRMLSKHQYSSFGIIYPVTKKQFRQLSLNICDRIKEMDTMENEVWDYDEGFFDRPVRIGEKCLVLDDKVGQFEEGIIEAESLGKLIIEVGREIKEVWKDSNALAKFIGEQRNESSKNDDVESEKQSKNNET